MSNNTINYNELILKNYQKKYPNLAEFSYDVLNDCLVYEGNFVKLNGYGLSRIDPVFFNMNPEDIFTFFKNAFYQVDNKNARIEQYLNQLIITEDEEETIQKYVRQYIDKLNIYARNAQFFDKYFQNENVKAFIIDFMETKKVIEEAKKLANPNIYNAYQMIANAYNSEMTKMNQQVGNSESKGMTLTKTKPGFNGYNEFDKNVTYLEELNKKDKMTKAGFTSMLLVISTTIGAGIYLALKLLG